MEASKQDKGGKMEYISLVPKKVPEEITETDYQRFLRVVSTDLNDKQKSQVVMPTQVYSHQENLLAVHWHPEFVPMELITRRINAMFPHRKQELIIPTQHNEILEYGPYAGVEVDCFSIGFNQKVQLLIHFERERVENAHIFKEMLYHTFKYRASQLFDFIHTLTAPVEERIQGAARETGANDSLVGFVRIYVKKIQKMLDKYSEQVPEQSIKNKLLRNFFDELRDEYGDPLIDRVQTYLKAVKTRVKADFPLHYFYRTSEIIEEARHLGACIVIPHPEQFWPVLLADYDVDGIEVWNPQSRRYTHFLISVLKRKNQNRRASQRKLLIFMGDDTHMGEKTRAPRQQNKEKAGREIGLQPAWEDLEIRKTLIMANCCRKRVIEDYKSRLAG